MPRVRPLVEHPRWSADPPIEINESNQGQNAAGACVSQCAHQPRLALGITILPEQKSHKIRARSVRGLVSVVVHAFRVMIEPSTGTPAQPSVSPPLTSPGRSMCAGLDVGALTAASLRRGRLMPWRSSGASDQLACRTMPETARAKTPHGIGSPRGWGMGWADGAAGLEVAGNAVAGASGACGHSGRPVATQRSPAAVPVHAKSSKGVVSTRDLDAQDCGQLIQGRS